MNRRAFLFASLATTSLAPAAYAAGSVHVIYVGGWDCPYCTTWKNRYKADWVASAEFKRVKWTEIDPPKLREAYQERYWPGELKAVLDQIPRKSGTPRFLIVADGKLVSNKFGVGDWEHSLGDLKKILR